jgi:predicted membrane-bound spermidine synthase
MLIKESWGDRLLYAAWTSVSIAAIIGLLLSWSAGQELLTYNKNSSAFDLVMSVLPFVIVSLIELTKVPLVNKIYKSAGGVSKLFLSIALLLVTLITFETLLAGLEREYVNYIDIMDELKTPVQLGMGVVTIWTVSLAFIVSTIGVFLASFGVWLKK